jgi:hypothetical protein
MLKMMTGAFCCTLVALVLCVLRIGELQQRPTLTETEWVLVQDFRQFQQETDGVGPILHPPYVACINGLTGKLEPRVRLLEFQRAANNKYTLRFADGEEFVVPAHELTMAIQDNEHYVYRKAE